MIDVTEFSVEHENGNTIISDQYDGKVHIINWKKGQVQTRDYWDEDFILDCFPVERWFELLLRKEE